MKLTAKQRLYINAKVNSPLLSDYEICRQNGISRNRPYEWRKNPEFVATLDEAYKEIWKNASKKAQDRMVKLLDSNKEEVALNAAKYILDANGYKQPTQLQVEATVNEIIVSIDD